MFSFVVVWHYNTGGISAITGIRHRPDAAEYIIFLFLFVHNYLIADVTPLEEQLVVPDILSKLV